MKEAGFSFGSVAPRGACFSRATFLSFGMRRTLANRGGMVLIGLCWLGCVAKEVNWGARVNALSDAGGDDVLEFMYGSDSLSPDERKQLIGRVGALRNPDKGDLLKVKATHQAEEFIMVVVEVPWAIGSRPPGLFPLIFTAENGEMKLIGFTRAFKEIEDQFDERQTESVLDLAMLWINNYASVQ
ncbi:MAG: hypothetical protein AAGB46_02960 [Verrucomicrobiota bacterium]